MERGDERAGVKRVIRACFSLANGSDGGNRDPMAATRPPKRVGQTDDAEPATRLSSPVFCAAPSPAHHDAPLIAERAVTRGRIATEVAMSAPVRESYQFERQPREPDRRRDVLGGRSTDPAPETQHPTQAFEWPGSPLHY